MCSRDTEREGISHLAVDQDSCPSLRRSQIVVTFLFQSVPREPEPSCITGSGVSSYPEVCI